VEREVDRQGGRGPAPRPPTSRSSRAQEAGPGEAGAGERPGKRTFDLAVASLLLFLATPVFALCALLVRLGSRGPVFFGHRRLGREGRPFLCLKFRTMVEGAEEWLNDDEALRREYRKNGFKLSTERDPRVTRVGRWLRKTHLDELPQLVNVLRGEMSLVGPRPIVEDELAHYGPLAEELLSLRPGVFGPWTALGPERPNYPERCGVELDYVRRPSLRRDIVLLVRNLQAVIRGQ